MFQLCLNEGYYTTVFKTAILCALPKIRNCPKHLPQLYCLIALLSCLENILERIVSRKLARIALKSRLISPVYFRAIKGRSTIDAAYTLTYDVEKSWEQENILIALEFNIKGAFDAVIKERLTKRLWQQKIPLSLIR